MDLFAHFRLSWLNIAITLLHVASHSEVVEATIPWSVDAAMKNAVVSWAGLEGKQEDVFPHQLWTGNTAVTGPSSISWSQTIQNTHRITLVGSTQKDHEHQPRLTLKKVSIYAKLCCFR